MPNKRLLGMLLCVALCACAGAKVRTKGPTPAAQEPEDPATPYYGGS